MSGFMKDARRSSGGGSLAAHRRKEDSRLKVGAKSKTTSSTPLRPGKHLAWYVAYNPNPLGKNLSGVPQIKWKCPTELNLDPDWRVACGEESSEVHAQKYRETTVIEAVYPHPLAIPPSPLISPDMEGKHDDERLIRLIPIVPIEEAGAIEMPCSSTSAPVKAFSGHSTSEGSSSVSPNPPTAEQSLLNILHGLEGRDLAIAAGTAAAVAAALQSKQEIDKELLVKLLTNPEMVKTGVNKNEIGTNSAQRFPSGPKSSTCPLSSNSTPDPGVDSFVPVAVNQPIRTKESASVAGGTPAQPQPIRTTESASDLCATPSRSLSVPVNESDSDLGVPPAKRARICTPNLVNNWGHAPRISNSHPPLIHALTDGAREPEIARSRIHGATGTNEPRPLAIPTPSYRDEQFERMVLRYANAAPMLPPYPSSARPNSEAANQPMHPPPFLSGMRPVSFPPPFPSTPTPFLHSHTGVRPCVGPSPPIPPLALGVNVPSCSTFRPSPLPYPYVRKFPAPVGDFTYCRTLVKQHGDHNKSNEAVLPNHGQQPLNNLHEQCTNPLQTNPTVQKPCMYFNTSKGCRNGSNCRYMHG